MSCRGELTDLGAVAAAVLAETRGQPVIAQAAIASVLLNRSAPMPVNPTPASLLRTDPDFLRAVSTVCLVVIGDLDDPTRGATRYHRHDETPAWASGLEPVALIGSHLFYTSS